MTNPMSRELRQRVVEQTLISARGFHTHRHVYAQVHSIIYTTHTLDLKREGDIHDHTLLFLYHLKTGGRNQNFKVNLELHKTLSQKPNTKKPTNQPDKYTQTKIIN